MPFYPSKVLRARERAPTPYSSVVFCLGLTFESHPGAPACPSTPPKCYNQERAPTPYSSTVFCLGLTFQSLKELGMCHLM